MLGAIQSGVLGGVRGPINLRALSGSPDQRPEEQSCCPEESICLKPLALSLPSGSPLVRGNAVCAVSRVLLKS